MFVIMLLLTLTCSREYGYFKATMQFSKTTMLPFTQLELFTHGLRSMKVNFNIFLGQQNHI